MSTFSPPHSPTRPDALPDAGTPPTSTPPRHVALGRTSPHPTTPTSSVTSDGFGSPESVASAVAAGRTDPTGIHSKDSSATSSVGMGSDRPKLSLDPSRSAFRPSLQPSPSTPLNPDPLHPSRGRASPSGHVHDSTRSHQQPAVDMTRLTMSSAPANQPSPTGEMDRRRLEIMAQLSGPSGGGTQHGRAYSPFGGMRHSPQPQTNGNRSSPPIFANADPFQQHGRSPYGPANPASSTPFRVVHPTPTTAAAFNPVGSPTTGRSARAGTSASIYAPKSPLPSENPSQSPTTNVNGPARTADKINVVISPKRDAWEIAAEQSRIRSGKDGFPPLSSGVGLGIDMGFGVGVIPDSAVNAHFGGPRSRAPSDGGTFGGRNTPGSMTPQMLLAEQLANIASGRSAGGPHDGRASVGFAPSPSPGLPAFLASQHQQMAASTYARSGSANSMRRNTSPFPATPPTQAGGGFQDPYTSALLSVLASQQLHQLQGQTPMLSSPFVRSVPDQRAQQLADQELLTRFEAIQYLHPDLFGRHPDGRGRASIGDADGSRLPGFGLDPGSVAAGYDASANGAAQSRAREMASFGGMPSNPADQDLLEYLIKHNLPLDGPSPNNKKRELYKTELCGPYMANLDKQTEQERCQYLSKCQYAHGHHELRAAKRHPKYKTQICTTFWLFGGCAYGRRCCFLHEDIPAGGIPELGELGTQESLQRILAARMVRPTIGGGPKSPSQNLSQILSQQNYFQSSSSDVAPSLESLSPLGHSHPLPQYRTPPPAPVQQSTARFANPNGGGFPLDGPGRSSVYTAPDERERGPNGLVLRPRDRSDSLSVNMNPIPELTSIPPSLPARSISFEQSSSYGGNDRDRHSMSAYTSSASSHQARSASFPDSYDDGSYLGQTNYPTGHSASSVHPSRHSNLSDGTQSARGSSLAPPSSGGHASRSASYTDGTANSRWAPHPSDNTLATGRPSVSTPKDEIVRVPGRMDRARSATWGVGSASPSGWNEDTSARQKEDIGAIGERIGLPSAGRKGIW